MRVRGAAPPEVVEQRETNRKLSVRLVCARCSAEVWKMRQQSANAQPVTAQRMMSQAARAHNRTCDGSWTFYRGEQATEMGKVDWS